MPTYTMRECLERAEKMGFYFVKLSKHNIYDVRDSDDNWVCLHIELPDYFRKLDESKPK